ncbi:MAG: pentapeptide repeat-containing protein [Methanosarcinaceae archaeon]
MHSGHVSELSSPDLPLTEASFSRLFSSFPEATFSEATFSEATFSEATFPKVSFS